MSSQGIGGDDVSRGSLAAGAYVDGLDRGPGHGLDEDDGNWLANLIATTVGDWCQTRVILGNGVVHVVLSRTSAARPNPSTDVHAPDEPPSTASFEIVRASSTTASLNPFAA